MKLKFESHLPKCISGILLAAAMFVCALLNSSSVRAVCALGSAVILVSILRIEISQPKLLRWLYGVAFLAVPAAAFFIGQIMQNISLLSVPLLCILLNIAIILIIQLFVLMISNSIRLSLTVGCAVPTLLVLLNTYVYMFRGNALMPSDFLSFGTATKIVSEYNFLPTPPMLYGLTMAAILILAVCRNCRQSVIFSAMPLLPVSVRWLCCARDLVSTYTAGKMTVRYLTDTW